MLPAEARWLVLVPEAIGTVPRSMRILSLFCYSWQDQQPWDQPGSAAFAGHCGQDPMELAKSRVARLLGTVPEAAEPMGEQSNLWIPSP